MSDQDKTNKMAASKADSPTKETNERTNDKMNYELQGDSNCTEYE